MTTKLSTSNLSAETLATISGPRISNVQIADSAYNTLDDTAANIGGGYIIINGQSFNSAAQVLIDQTPATTITWVSNTQIRAQVPAAAEGTSRSVYVINPDGSLALLVNGLTYSAFPAWSTGSTLTSFEALVPISIQLSAPTANNYTLAASNTLPSAVTLYANGLIAGTVAANTTTNYNFTVIAKDNENQDTSRSFTLPITKNNEPAWVTAADLGSVSTGANYSSTLVATDLSNVTYSVAAGSTLPSSLTLAANGLLSGNVSAANTYSFGIVATDTANLSNTRTFSITIITPDAYAPYNTLLLNGDGAASTNGANNNVFIDSSANNLSIQGSGNPRQGTFSPYTQNGWSNYIDGTLNVNLLTAANSSLNLGSGNWTIEAWIYLTTATSGSTMFYIASNRLLNGSTANGPLIGILNQKLYLRDGNGALYNTQPTTLSVGVWYHIAVCRSGSSIYSFINGAQEGTTYTYGSAPTYAANQIAIGYEDQFGFTAVPGYISNLRVVKGTALYTSTFTPSTTPLTAIANTSLLTSQSNRFIDNGPNNIEFTLGSGAPSAEAFSPFITSVAYTPSLHGGSAYFDGTEDLLTTPNSSTVGNFGTAPFTVEFWMYSTDSNSVLIRQNASGTPNWAIIITSGSMYWQNGHGTSSIYYIGLGSLTTNPLRNAWTHIAITRNNANELRFWINGVGQTAYGGQDTTDYNSTNGVVIGSGTYGLLTGYLSDVRIVKGTAVYTGNFTPPTSKLTAIANTSLLANFTNAGIIDQTSKNNLETAGDARVSTAVKKYGTGSMYFDGTGDYLSIPSSTNFQFGTGDFTIEAWLYPTAIDATASYIFDQRTTSTQAVMLAYILTGGTIEIYVNGGVVASGGTIALNSWSHFAITRASNSLKMFLNGTQIGSTYTLSATLINAPMFIGSRFNATQYFNGYMDDFRITKGYARYTTTFTPPTAALTNY